MDNDQDDKKPGTYTVLCFFKYKSAKDYLKVD